MDLTFWLLLVDAVMAGVILSVQLLVYPAFQYFSDAELVRWHHRYTPNITILVAPLMTLQLIGGLVRAFGQPGMFTFLYALLVLLLWILTFLFFVPLHRRIDGGRATERSLRRLVYLNWSRTLLWIALFISNLWWFMVKGPGL